MPTLKRRMNLADSVTDFSLQKDFHKTVRFASLSLT